MEKEYGDELSSEARENSSWIARGTIPSLPSVPSCNQLYLHLSELPGKVSGTQICHKFSSNLFRTSTNQPLCRFCLSQSGHMQECRHCARQVQIWGLVLLLGKHPLHGPHWNESYCRREKLTKWVKDYPVLTPDQKPYQHWTLFWSPLTWLQSSLVRQ